MESIDSLTSSREFIPIPDKRDSSLRHIEPATLEEVAANDEKIAGFEPPKGFLERSIKNLKRGHSSSKQFLKDHPAAKYAIIIALFIGLAAAIWYGAPLVKNLYGILIPEDSRAILSIFEGIAISYNFYFREMI